MKSLSSWFANFMDNFFGKLCTRCNRSRTEDKSGLCDMCKKELEIEEEIAQKRKRVMYCPKCGGYMKPEKIRMGITHVVVIDRCIICKGIFMEDKKAREFDIALVEKSFCDAIGKTDTQQAISFW